jgi:AcrR family transcriptional regulator
MYQSTQKEFTMKERGRPRSFDRSAALRRAMEVFWEKGYEGASMTDLTSAMAINSPSLYAAFGSKEKLFEEAVTLYLASEGTEIWSALSEAPTAREAVEQFLTRTAISFTRQNKPAGCLVVLGALHADKGREAACGLLRSHRTENVVALRERMEHGVREGDLPADTDCLKLATFYATVQQGMSIQARDGASREILLAVADSAMAAWEPLILDSQP